MMTKDEEVGVTTDTSIFVEVEGQGDSNDILTHTQVDFCKT